MKGPGKVTTSADLRADVDQSTDEGGRRISEITEG